MDHPLISLSQKCFLKKELPIPPWLSVPLLCFIYFSIPTSHHLNNTRYLSIFHSFARIEVPREQELCCFCSLLNLQCLEQSAWHSVDTEEILVVANGDLVELRLQLFVEWLGGELFYSLFTFLGNHTIIELYTMPFLGLHCVIWLVENVKYYNTRQVSFGVRGSQVIAV